MEVTAVAEHAAPPVPYSEPTRASTFGYKPALDGLRAVAVLAVMAYHFGAGWSRGGFLGVDMFFVLSGYLITSLLLVEWAHTDSIRLSAFWARRARRLLPAMFLVLIGIALWTRLDLPSDRWSEIRGDGLWTFFYAANWNFIEAGRSYFSADLSPLRHTWSLAIEEQFYLLWPLVVFALLRLARGRHVLLVATCVAGTLASLIASIALYNSADPSRAYYGTDTRVSQLLIGALVAVVLLRWTPASRSTRIGIQVLGVVAAGAIIWAFVTVSDQRAGLYRGGFVLFAIGTAAVIGAVVQTTRNPLRAALCLAPVRWVGQVSYGVYLWHWPIRVAIDENRTNLSGWELAVVRVAATFAIAALSYYLVELPIRRRRFLKVWTPRLLLPASGALVVGALLIATVGATAPDPLRQRPGTVLATDPPTNTPPVAAVPGTPTQRTLLLGDSVAYTLGDALVAESAGRGVEFQTVTRLGCGMTDGIALTDEGEVVSWSPACASSTAQYIDAALKQSQPDVVLWMSTWELSSYRVDGKVLAFGTQPFEEWLTSQIESVRVRAANAGARLVLVAIPPQADNPMGPPKPEQAVRTAYLNALFRRYASTRPTEVGVLELTGLVCPNGAPCPTTIDGIVLRPKDGGHFQAEGAAWVAPRFMDELFAVLRDMDQTPTTTTTAGR